MRTESKCRHRKKVAGFQPLLFFAFHLVGQIWGIFGGVDFAVTAIFHSIQIVSKYLLILFRKWTLDPLEFLKILREKIFGWK